MRAWCKFVMCLLVAMAAFAGGALSTTAQVDPDPTETLVVVTICLDEGCRNGRAWRVRR